jgi:outer membrane lipoprotein LolB
MLSLVLAGCSRVQTRSSEDPASALAYQSRFDQLELLSDWTLEGRLAISDGNEGGSGSLSWFSSETVTRMSFRGAMGKGAWQLQSDANGARLELADGAVRFAPTVAELVLEQVGWKVPVEALSWWIKGLALPGEWEARLIDAEGRVVELRQSGWDVDFSNYSLQENLWLPGKLTARRGNYLVKMAIRKWRLGAEGSGVE